MTFLKFVTIQYYLKQCEGMSVISKIKSFEFITLSSLSDNMLLSAIGVLFISSGALCAPSDAVEVGVCDGDGCFALKSSIGAIEVILFTFISIAMDTC